MLCQRHIKDLPVNLACCQLCHLDHELFGQIEGDADSPICQRLHLVHDGPELDWLHLALRVGAVRLPTPRRPTRLKKEEER